jgi:hypothetical protein
VNEDYIFKVRAMFNRLEGQIEDIIQVWTMKFTRRLVLDTPGPGNQWDATEYIAVGRLRMGWTWGFHPPASVLREGLSGAEDHSQYGVAAQAKLTAQFAAMGVHPLVYLWNDVGYGVWVHEGIGTHSHIGPRPWVELLATTGAAHRMLTEARLEVMGGSGANRS